MMVRHFSKIMFVAAMAATLSLTVPTTTVQAQLASGGFEVQGESQTIEIPQSGNQRLKFDFKIPELLVENPEVIKATPVSPNEILVSGLKPGVSALTVSDAQHNLHVVNVHVTIDIRKLQHAINIHFPDSSVTVHALQTGVVLKGQVAKNSDINNVMQVASDFFPTNVINQLVVGGSQTVAIKVKVYEVSRTKLRELGIDWSLFGQDFEMVSGFSDLITNFADGSASDLNYRLGIFGNNTNLELIIKALESRSIAKLLDEPVLTAENGRPAEFLSGGEIPIQINNGLGQVSVEFRAFGTKLDMVPIVHGGGEITLEVRAEVSEVDNTLSNGAGVPGFRVRRVNTGVKMRAGHTLALAGDYREEIETEHNGLPHFMDMPFINMFTSKKRDSKNETELVFLITPKFVSDVPGPVGPLPGRTSTSPSDVEFYRNGYLEVPPCQDDCPVNRGIPPQQVAPQQVAPQQVLPGQTGYNFNDNANRSFQQSSYPQTGYPSSGNPVQGNSSGFSNNPNVQSNGFHWPSNK